MTFVLELPEDWRSHFGLVAKIVAAAARNPFDAREPVVRTDAAIRLEFTPDPNVRASIQRSHSDKSIALLVPAGAYVRARMVCLALAKNAALRTLPRYFLGKGLSATESSELIRGARNVFPTFEGLLGWATSRLADVGGAEPCPRYSAFGSEVEHLTYMAVNFLTTHELSHFWYGHYSVRDGHVSPPPPNATSLMELQADVGAGTSLADHVAADLEVSGVPSTSERFALRAVQLSQAYGMVTAAVLDFLDVLHPHDDLHRPEHVETYLSHQNRLETAGFGFRLHALRKLGGPVAERASMAFAYGGMTYAHAAGIPQSDHEKDRQKLTALLAQLPELSDKLVPHMPNVTNRDALATWQEELGRQAIVADPQNLADALAQVKRIARSPQAVGSTRTRRGNVTQTEQRAAARDWLDPFRAYHPDVTDGVLEAVLWATELAQEALTERLRLSPDVDDTVRFGVRPADLLLSSFELGVPRSLTARLALFMRALFDLGPDRQPPSAALGAGRVNRYESLFGVPRAYKGARLKWWASTVVQGGPADGSWNSRNVWRYALLFGMFRSIARIHRDHFRGMERAHFEAAPADLPTIHLGLTLDADLSALWSLIVYADNRSFQELAPEHRSTPSCRVGSRSEHFRALFLGTFAFLSFHDRTVARLDFSDRPSLNPTVRLEYATASLDDIGIPTDGEPMFAAVDRTNIAKGPWNWRAFFHASLRDWDRLTSLFQRRMAEHNGLGTSPSPFVVHSSHASSPQPPFPQENAAKQAAAPYLRSATPIFISGKAFQAKVGATSRQ